MNHILLKNGVFAFWHEKINAYKIQDIGINCKLISGTLYEMDMFWNPTMKLPEQFQPSKQQYSWMCYKSEK